MIKKLVPVTIVAAVGLALAVAVPHASATPQQDAAGEVAVSGRILIDGSPVRTGQVTLVAWPSTETLTAAAAVNQPLELRTVHSGTADSNGNFVAALDPTSLPPEYLEPGGMVGLQLDVTDGIRQATWNFSVLHQSGRGWLDSSGDPKLAAPVSLTFDLGSSPSVTDQEQVQTEVSSLPMKSKAFGAEAALDCNITGWGPTHYGIEEYFSRLHGTANAPARMIQSVGSIHTLGIGMSTAFSGGTWSAGGTLGASSGMGVRGAAMASSVRIYNKVNYIDVYVDCYPWVMQRRPLSIAALNSKHVAISAPTWAYVCTPYPPGTEIEKDHGRNTTMSLGVDIGPINVSAQSGWTSRLVNYWYVVNTEHLCGSQPAGPATSPEARTK